MIKCNFCKNYVEIDSQKYYMFDSNMAEYFYTNYINDEQILMATCWKCLINIPITDRLNSITEEQYLKYLLLK